MLWVKVGGGGVIGGSIELLVGKLIELVFLGAMNDEGINELGELFWRGGFGFVVGFSTRAPLMLING